MKRLRLLPLFCFFASISLFGQDYNFINVNYLTSLPVIDGKPDASVKQLAEFQFTRIDVSKENLKYPDAVFRIGYNQDYLYLLIRVNSDTIKFRDRAYQNGDGFHMVVAMPKPGGEPADEFYVLRFSPKSVKDNFAGLKGVWYYNIDLSGKRLPTAQFEAAAEKGVTYYEALIPWNEIPPYHPFNREGMGFNLCFVKADGKSEKVYYYAQYDEKIQWEQNKRKYIPLKFESPVKSKNVLSWFIPERRNLFEGNNIKGELAVYSPGSGTFEFVSSVSTIDGYIPQSVQTKINVHEGLDYYPVSIPSSDIVEGGYNLRWRFADDVIKIFPITILPPFNRKDKFELLTKQSAVLSQGSQNTIIYRVNEIQESIDKIKPYENAGPLRDRMLKLETDIKRIIAGEDPYKAKTGIFRRAYLSKVDNTYQPYSIKVPADFNPAKKYPLFVLLHGSGQLDNGMLEGYDYTKGEFIEAAPSGRGTTNCYSADNAQDDIGECINDVIANYNIDEKNIVLAGFSMGGYGVFRTYYETPDRFAGLAVFSGHPNLANKWLEGKHPNFTNAETLKLFRKIPMFIYHDKIDMNCPFDIMEGTVKILQVLGADLKFVVSSGLGHNILNESNREAFYSWLSKFSGK